MKYFDGFFKACNYPCPFTYGDFIHPGRTISLFFNTFAPLAHNFVFVASRKTVQILRFLHNYLLFYTKVQEEVVETANDKVKLYNQLLSKKNQLQLQQEELKIRWQMVSNECTTERDMFCVLFITNCEKQFLF